MKRYWPVFCLILAFPAKAIEINCPSTLQVAQSASEIPGWHTGGDKERDHTLDYIAVGNINDGIPFREDDEKTKGNISKSIWLLMNPKTDYSISCIYNSTDKILYRPVPEHVQRCESTYKVPKWGPYQFIKMECR